MANKTLIRDDLNQAAEAFQAAWPMALSRFVSQEQRAQAQSFCIELASAHKPWLLVSPEGVADLVDNVFHNPVLTEFVQALVFHFFARWAEASDEETYKAFCKVLAKSTSNDIGQVPMRALPTDYRERMNTEEETEALLLANKWLVAILMICMFITPATIRSPKTD